MMAPKLRGGRPLKLALRAVCWVRGRALSRHRWSRESSTWLRLAHLLDRPIDWLEAYEMRDVWEYQDEQLRRLVKLAAEVEDLV
jgi:hypothetical protein